jgi:hypothetical protein
VETAQTRGWFARRANLSQSALLISIPNQKQNPHVSSHMRGVSRSSRTRDGMRWTRAVLLTRAQACGRRSRVVLTPRRWRQVGEVAMSALTGLTRRADDGDKRARSPGRARRKPLKPLRAGMPGVPVDLWRLPRVLSTFAHEATGAAGTRHSPRPLFSGRRFNQRPGRMAPRGAGACLNGRDRMAEFDRSPGARDLHSSPGPYPAIRPLTFSISALDNSGGVPI